MKLKRILLVVATAMILPLALVSVGYAQELNCWGLRPTKTDEATSDECPSLWSRRDEDSNEPIDPDESPLEFNPESRDLGQE